MQKVQLPCFLRVIQEHSGLKEEILCFSSFGSYMLSTVMPVMYKTQALMCYLEYHQTTLFFTCTS